MLEDEYPQNSQEIYLWKNTSQQGAIQTKIPTTMIHLKSNHVSQALAK